MSYCTIENLKKAIDEQIIIDLSNDLNEDSPAPTEINEDNVNKQIVKADARINGYLRGRYVIPLDPVPGEIEGISVDISLYFLYTRRPHRGVPKEIDDKFKDAIYLLKDIKKGDFLIDATTLGGGTSEESVAGSGDIRTNKTASDRIFNKDLMSRF